MTGEIPQIEITSEARLWAWLSDNTGGPSVWLLTCKAAHRDKYLSRDQVLDALVAHGWIDGTAPSYRRNVLRFLAAAKRPETRARRANLIADHAGRGQKVPQF